MAGENESTTKEIEAVDPASALLGLARMSKHWPASYRERIPIKVRMAKDLGPDMWGIMPKGPRIWVHKDDELPVQCNQHGAMSVVTQYGNLGVKPLECEIIEWRAPNSAERPNDADQAP